MTNGMKIYLYVYMIFILLLDCLFIAYTHMIILCWLIVVSSYCETTGTPHHHHLRHSGEKAGILVGLYSIMGI